MIASCFIRGFIESPDQILEDQAHLVIGNGIGMQVDVGEFPDDQVEPVKSAADDTRVAMAKLEKLVIGNAEAKNFQTENEVATEQADASTALIQ